MSVPLTSSGASAAAWRSGSQADSTRPPVPRDSGSTSPALMWSRTGCGESTRNRQTRIASAPRPCFT